MYKISGQHSTIYETRQRAEKELREIAEKINRLSAFCPVIVDGTTIRETASSPVLIQIIIEEDTIESTVWGSFFNRHIVQ